MSTTFKVPYVFLWFWWTSKTSKLWLQFSHILAKNESYRVRNLAIELVKWELNATFFEWTLLIENNIIENGMEWKILKNRCSLYSEATLTQIRSVKPG